MKLFLKKFGTTLTSRQSGSEAYNAIRPLLSALADDELIEVDFDGVVTFSPSWADEFFTPMKKEFGGRLMFKETDNPSVKATFDLLNSIHEQQL